MQYHWLNKQNNDKLIIFFAGWSFDYKPFEFLACDDFDVLTIYDYSAQRADEAIKQSPLNEKIFTFSSGYKKIYLIAWSMGVFVAYQIRDKLPKFDNKIAVNGTPFPIDDEFGIPQKPFLLTLRHAQKGLEGKFYQNIFDKPEEFERYTKTPVERSIENRVGELKSLYGTIKAEMPEKTDFETAEQARGSARNFYNAAIVSNRDKIIPPKNQLNFWRNKAKIIDSGHFPFYNFKSWNEILCR